MIDDIKKKIKNKKLIIGIIGLGYVGLPLFIRFSQKGYKVIGLDIDASKIQKLKKGTSYIKHLNFIYLKKTQKKGCIFSDNFELVSKIDFLILCLPTPLNKKREPDMTCIKKTLLQIRPYLRERQIISLESTTYPGTTEELIVSLVSKKFNIGTNFCVIYSPEREDPGREDISLKDIPKVMGGFTPKCKNVGKLLYSIAFNKIISVSSLQVAEFSKLLENIYRSVNIGLINEMKIVADKMKINIHEVIDASKTKPFGFKAFYPGPGLGGHCIPIDPFYLTWKAKKYGIDTKFIKLSGIINRKITHWVISKVLQKFKEEKILLKKATILISGVAYKKNIDDIRESPALEIIKFLQKKVKKIYYHDPYISKIPINRNYNINLHSSKLTTDLLKKISAAIIVTDHDNINYSKIQKNCSLVFDSRNVYKKDIINVIKV
jgi:UDP-N-acetyl-D-glucosamine dehydrogenase